MINRNEQIITKLDEIKAMLAVQKEKSISMQLRDRVYGQTKHLKKLQIIQEGIVLLENITAARTGDELKNAMEKLDHFLTQKNTDLQFDPLAKAFGHGFSDFKQTLKMMWQVRNTIIAQEFGEDEAFANAKKAYKGRQLTADSIAKEIRKIQPQNLKEVFAMGHFFERIPLIVALYEGKLRSRDRKLMSSALSNINTLIKNDDLLGAYKKILQLQIFLVKKLSKYKIYESQNDIPFYATLEKLKEDLVKYENVRNKTDIKNYLADDTQKLEPLIKASQLTFEKKFQKTYDTLESKFYAAITSHHLLAGDVLAAKSAKGMNSEVAALFDNALIAFALGHGALFIGGLAEKSLGHPIAKAAVIAAFGAATKEIKGKLTGGDVAGAASASKNAKLVPREMIEVVASAISSEFARCFAFQINQAHITDNDSKFINEMVRLGLQSALKNLGQFQDEIKAIKWEEPNSNPLDQFAKIIVRAMRFNPTEFGKFHPVYSEQEVFEKTINAPSIYRGGKVELENVFTKSGYAVVGSDNKLTFYDPPGSDPNKYGYIFIDAKDAKRMQIPETCEENIKIDAAVRKQYEDILQKANHEREDVLKQKADNILKRPAIQAELINSALTSTPTATSIMTATTATTLSQPMPKTQAVTPAKPFTIPIQFVASVDIRNQLEALKARLAMQRDKSLSMQFRDRIYGQRKEIKKLQVIHQAILLVSNVERAVSTDDLRVAMEKLDRFLTTKNTDLQFDPLEKAFGHHLSDFKQTLQMMWQVRNSIITLEFGKDNAFDAAQKVYNARQLTADSVAKEIQKIQPQGLKDVFARGHFFKRIPMIVELYAGKLRSRDRKLIRGALQSINTLIKNDNMLDAYIKIRQLQAFLVEKLSHYKMYQNSADIPFYSTLEKLKKDLENDEASQKKTTIQAYKIKVYEDKSMESGLVEASQLSFDKKYQKTYDTLESKFYAAITSHHLLTGDVLAAKANIGMGSEVAALFDNALVAFAIKQGVAILGGLAEKSSGSSLAKVAVGAAFDAAIKDMKGKLTSVDAANALGASNNARLIPREMIEIVASAVSNEFARSFAFQIKQAHITDTDSKFINEMVRLGLQSALKNLGQFQDEIKAIKWDDPSANPLDQFAKIIVRAMRFNPTEFGKFHAVYAGQEVSEKGISAPGPYRGGKVELEHFFTKSGYVVVDQNNKLTFYDPPGSQPEKYGYIFIDAKDAGRMQIAETCKENKTIDPAEYVDILNQANQKRENILKQKADSILKRPIVQAALLDAAIAPPSVTVPPASLLNVSTIAASKPATVLAVPPSTTSTITATLKGLPANNAPVLVMSTDYVQTQLEAIRARLKMQQAKTLGMQLRDRIYGQRKESKKQQVIHQALLLLDNIETATTKDELKTAMDKFDRFLTKKNTDLQFDPLAKAFGHNLSDFKLTLQMMWKVRNSIIAQEFSEDDAFKKAKNAYQARALTADSIAKEIQRIQPQSLKEVFATGHFFKRIPLIVALYEGNLKSRDRKLIRSALSSINSLIKNDKMLDAYIKIRQLQAYLVKKLSKYELYQSSANIPFYNTLEKLKQDLEKYEASQKKTTIQEYKIKLHQDQIKESDLVEASQLSFDKKFQKTHDTLESKFYAAITSHHLLAGDVLATKAGKGMNAEVVALFDNALVGFALSIGTTVLGDMVEKSLLGSPLKPYSKAAVIAAFGAATKEIKGKFAGEDAASTAGSSKNARLVPREMVEIVASAVSSEFARCFAFQINQAHLTDTDSKFIDEMIRLGLKSALKNLGEFQDEIKNLKWNDPNTNPLEQFAKIIVRAMRFNPTEFGKFHAVYAEQQLPGKETSPFNPYRGGKVELEHFFTQSGYVVVGLDNKLTFYDPPGSQAHKYGYIFIDAKDAERMRIANTCIKNETIDDDVRKQYENLMQQANKKSEDIMKQKADSIVHRPALQAALVDAAIHSNVTPSPQPQSTQVSPLPSVSIPPSQPVPSIAPVVTPAAVLSHSDTAALSSDKPILIATATTPLVPSPAPPTLDTTSAALTSKAPTASTDVQHKHWEAANVKRGDVSIDYKVELHREASTRLVSTVSLEHLQNFDGLKKKNMIGNVFNRGDRLYTNLAVAAMEVVDNTLKPLIDSKAQQPYEIAGNLEGIEKLEPYIRAYCNKLNNDKDNPIMIKYMIKPQPHTILEKFAGMVVNEEKRALRYIGR